MDLIFTLVFILKTIIVSTLMLVGYRLYLHPLAGYHGPWYAASTSLALAIISLLKLEPWWLQNQVRKYGTSKPIRISPSILLFPAPSSLKDIYRDPKFNQKSTFYGSGALGPPQLFSTLDGEEHRVLRKALAGNHWSIGSLKNYWESRMDDHVNLFMEKMRERAEKDDIIYMSDKVAEFSADIMTMLSFTTPWGFVKNGRDERGILTSWRDGLEFFGFASRFSFLREYMMGSPVIGSFLLPKTVDESGIVYLMCQADREVTEREHDKLHGIELDKPDLLDYCLNARINEAPLTPQQKRAHVTLLIQAGADTTGTGLGATLRFLTSHPKVMEKAIQEIQAADQAGNLSTPVTYEESRTQLNYFSACIKEALRLNPPAPNLLPRVVGKEGKWIDGHFVPPGTDVTSNAYIVQRDPKLYAPDPNSFRPERWLDTKEKTLELEAASLVFGTGPRVCLGKDIATMELYKLLPEIIRRFDMNVIDEGKYVVAGGVAYNKDFRVRLVGRVR